MSKGVVRELSNRIEKLASSNNHIEAFRLISLRDDLVTNGYRIPHPPKFLNQRQKRKIKRSNQNS